jgi:hypothetical protein
MTTQKSFVPGEIVESGHTGHIVRVTQALPDASFFSGTLIGNTIVQGRRGSVVMLPPQFQYHWHAWRVSSFELVESQVSRQVRIAQ